MTENENLEKQIADDLSAVLKEAKEMGCKEVAYFRHIPLQNVETVVNALYEIQQYRAIGTVEELKALKNKHIGKDNMVISSSDLMTILNSDSEELKQYKEVGTVEEFKDLKEKSVAKIPDYEGDGCWDGHVVIDTWICPNCEKHYEVDYDDYEYCPNCGQHIDHSGLTEDD